MLPTFDQLATLQTRLGADLIHFAPELLLTGGILLLLLARLFPRFDKIHLCPLAIVVVAAALGVLLSQWNPDRSRTAFSGLLALDPLADFVRAVILAATLLVLLLTRLTGLPDAEDSTDFGVLLLGATLGMLLMASANHLLIMFLAIEMASLPSYALAGFLKGRRTGSEAALKYVVFGAASAGVMLYGISLLAGNFGSGHLPTVANGYAKELLNGSYSLAGTAGLVLLLVGLGFKLAVVPIHFWLPDVFAGAAAEVGAFLSVASKAAAIGLLARILFAFQDAATAIGVDPSTLPTSLGVGLAIVAAITATFGNLAALAQTDLKRLLAYSTIAHAGYMLMGLATFSRIGVAAVLFYLVAYLFMNLGAFAVVALVRHHAGSETVDACRGLIRRSPAVGIALAAFLLSLLGLPPLAGFVGKFQVFAALYDAGRICPTFQVVLAIAVLNTVVSAGYYLKVLRAAGLDEPTALDATGQPVPLGESWSAALYVVGLALALVAIGIVWGPIAEAAAAAAGGS